MTDDPEEGATSAEPMSWDEFTRRLAVAFGRMAVDSFLVLALPPDAGGERPYVQFAHWGDRGASAGFRAEASGGRHLPDPRRLTPVQEDRLVALGWERPSADDRGQNFHREWATPAPVAEVAALVERTLREAFGIASPTDLRFIYASFHGTDVEALSLGLEPERKRPRPRHKPQRHLPAAPLAPIVEDGLRRWLGVDRLERDADGDYPIPVGSALVFVRVADSPLPMIAVFSSILTGVEGDPALFAALNDINRRIRFARAFWLAGAVVIATELPAVDITADQIAFACVQLAGLADYLDDVLHGRFGGGFAFEGRSARVN